MHTSAGISRRKNFFTVGDFPYILLAVLSAMLIAAWYNHNKKLIFFPAVGRKRIFFFPLSAALLGSFGVECRKTCL
ncbi:MAG: hypothetical protein ACTTH8_07040 [Treponema sp.]